MLRYLSGQRDLESPVALKSVPISFDTFPFFTQLMHSFPHSNVFAELLFLAMYKPLFPIQLMHSEVAPQISGTFATNGQDFFFRDKTKTEENNV